MTHPSAPAPAAPPTILQVGAGLGQGGVERGIVEMAEYLVNHGWRSLVASADGPLVETLLRVGGEHFDLPLTRRDPISIFRNAGRLARIIRANNVSLVHARSRAPAWAAWWACKLTGTPFVTTFHGTYGLQNVFKRAYNSVMVRGRLVIAISGFIKDHICRNYGVDPARIRIAYRGYDPRRFDPTKVESTTLDRLWEEWEIPTLTPVICMPGRLTRWKGHEVFIAALKEMKHLPWKAVIVGGYDTKAGYFTQLWSQVDAADLSRRVLFLGGRDDMADIYAASDVVVCPATEPEAFGRVVVEAQAMGTPVIASNIGGPAETVKSGQTGWLVRPNDPHRLALAMTDAITDSDRLSRMGKAASSWVKETFTTDRMCASELSVYKEILGLSDSAATSPQQEAAHG